MQKLSLFQRFMADTPKFEKGIQLLMLVCAALLAYASKLGYVPAAVFDVLSGAFGGVAVVCQFAYEHDAEIKALIADPSQALSMIPQLHAQVTNLVEALKAPPVVTLSTIEDVAAQLKPVTEIKADVEQSAPGLGAWPQSQPGTAQQNTNQDPETSNQ